MCLLENSLVETRHSENRPGHPQTACSLAWCSAAHGTHFHLSLLQGRDGEEQGRGGPLWAVCVLCGGWAWEGFSIGMKGWHDAVLVDSCIQAVCMLCGGWGWGWEGFSIGMNS